MLSGILALYYPRLQADVKHDFCRQQRTNTRSHGTEHRREAARLRLLATSATTAVKARLPDQARQHDLLASMEPEASADPSVSNEPF
jgi:hypothetical protein